MKKITTLLAVCCVASIAALPVLACDEETKKVRYDAAQCQAAAKVVSVDRSAECSSAKTIARQLAAALDAMQSSGQADVPGRAQVLAAVTELARVKPDLVCSKKLVAWQSQSAKPVAVSSIRALGDCASSCSSAKATVVASKDSTCSKATTATVLTKSGDSSQCCSKTKAAQVVASKASTCSKAKAAQVVASKSSTCSEAKVAQIVASKSSTCSEAKVAQVVASKSSTCSEAKAAQVVASKSSTCSKAQTAQVVASKSSTCSTAKAAQVVG